ncbi:sensor histidine kinase [Jeotgalibacillus sp. R-1-5s-1]|uniref:sensor histidine kinase n=1 Tax=Jeotgalibacillus sp. R-1-5s-1 TaxID=2555897 RepID=UPI0010699BC8|nr:sensor histidine kinase [Jeotgalibacillus sp. R-1-5s-1]TFE02479.1 sensor histidine kinase [Jeotgalibacillus sp. R-1-5s-1]
MLILAMIERLGIIVTVAFLLTRLSFFRRLFDSHGQIDVKQRILLVIVFGCFGIIGTYTGIIINPMEDSIDRWTRVLNDDEAIANSRVLGVVVAGLLGGWRIGVGAGLIAGVHRFFLGGFTGIACGLATIVAGAMAGIISSKQKKSRIITPKAALVVGASAEAVQMLIILGMARPFDRAWALVQDIGIPMIVANGIGTALFVLIIRSVIQEEERMGAVQSQKALRIANLTLTHMRKGLTPVSAAEVCAILYKEIPSLAVAITDRTTILSHIGNGLDHHGTGEEIRTEATKYVIETGQGITVGKQSIQCDDPDCPLQAAVIAPLKQKDKTIGTLKVYFSSERMISPIMLELIRGLSTLLSHQLEIADGEKHKELARESEIRMLQAQVSPHFLFNALNTIVSLTRTNPDHARKLLISLSAFFRQNLSGTTKKISTVSEEIEHVKAYLSIEEARFYDRLDVSYDVDPDALSAAVPPMTLQPLVENAIKHGLKGKSEGGRLVVRVYKEGDRVKIEIEDNGLGMETERLHSLISSAVPSEKGTGIGLYNLNERLIKVIDEEAGLAVSSEKGNGTTVRFSVPAPADEFIGEVM